MHGTQLLRTGLRHYMWVVAAVVGLLLVGVGSFFVIEGFAAKGLVQTALAEEAATTAGDAVIPDAPIVDLATAEAQAEVIRNHTLGRLGPYSEMDREDPNRDVYLKGLTLRNALNLAVMGFQVADLVIGVGALLMVMGVANITLLAPVLFWLRRPERENHETGAGPRLTQAHGHA